MQDPNGAPLSGSAVSPPPASQQQRRGRAAAELCGRDDLMAAVTATLGGPEGRGLVLYGPRRSGKTAVLLRLAETLAAEGVFPVYVDLDGRATRPLDAVLAEIAAAIAPPLALAAPVPRADVAAWFEDEWLPHVLHALPDGAALALLVDELDVLPEPREGQAAGALYPYLRRVLDAFAPRVRLVLALGRCVDDHENVARLLFRSLPVERLTLLERPHADALFLRASPRFRADALDAAWDFTRGHPYFIGALGAQLAKRGPLVSTADVQVAVEAIVTQDRGAFEWMWSALPQGAQLCAAALSQSSVAVTEEALRRTLKLGGADDGAKEIREALATLADELWIESPGPGRWRFQVEILRRLVARAKPLATVKQAQNLLERAIARPAHAPAAPPGGVAPVRVPAAPRPRPSEAPSIQVGPDLAELRHALEAERAARVGAELRAGTLAAEREELVAEREKHLAALQKLAVAQAKMSFDLEAAVNERDRVRLELDALIADRESQNPRGARLSIANLLGKPAAKVEPPPPSPAPPPPEPPAPEPVARITPESVAPPAEAEAAPREAEPAPPRPPPQRALGERAAPPVFLALAVAMLGAVYALFPRRIEIAPGPVTLEDRGAARALHVERVVGFGKRRPSVGATWASADPRVARVDAEGRVIAVGHGKTRVEAQDGGLRAAVEITVRLPARLSLAPAAVTLDPDHPEAALEATLVDADGAPWSRAGAALAFTSSEERVAVVSAGKVKRTGPGAATVEVRYGELRAAVAVTSLDRKDALARGCDAGAADRCVALGRLLDQGEAGVAPDRAAALALFQKACDAGAARACAELGARAEAEAAPDLVKIAGIYQKACDAKDPYGCARLGRIFETGLGVVGSSARALALYRAACDEREPEGCYRLGAMVELGHGVARDTPAAVELYRKACEGGLVAACAAAANMFFHGSGSVPKDLPAAVALYDKACDARHEPSCTVMALKHKSGEGVEEDRAKSLAYFAKACAAGSKAACVIASQR